MFVIFLDPVLGLCFSQREKTYIPVNENEACSGSVKLCIGETSKGQKKLKENELFVLCWFLRFLIP